MARKYNKIKMDDIKGNDLTKLNEMVNDTRRELFNLRMDIFKTSMSVSGQKKAIKKNIARLLTARSAKVSSVSKG